MESSQNSGGDIVPGPKQDRNGSVLQALARYTTWAVFPTVSSLVLSAVFLACPLAGSAFAQTVAAEKLDRLTTGSTEKKTYLPEFKVGNDREYVKFSGHINKGVVVHDDGVQTLDYWFVDNGNSPTRARMEVYSAVGDHMAFGGMVEGQWNPYSTTKINQTNRGYFNGRRTLLRKAEGWIGDNADSNMYGRLWFGQGSTASDGTAEIDYSGTAVVGYSGVADSDGGQFFRLSGTNALSTVTINRGFANLDGFGRRLRVRYDTPVVAGFKLSGSYGTTVVPKAVGKPGWDVALRYLNDKGGTKFQVAAAYIASADNTWGVMGSASVLLPSYVNFSVAAGTRTAGATGVSERFVYGKVGYIAHLIEAGTTAFSVDGYLGNNFNTAGSRSTSYGLQVVQNLDYWRTELYLGLRRYEFSEVTTAYHDGFGILAGARIKF